MAKEKKGIAFGVATKVAGIIASKSFDAVTNLVRNFGSGKVTKEDIANLQIEIQKLKTKAEETEKECEALKEELLRKDDIIKKLKEEKTSLSNKLVWISAIGILFLVLAIIFFII